ncbi:hypothetical protein NE237_029916 [Protea cynaroides]|uniref:Uncharacterized protein n=1 Tax=Protea cynaroides TaxID=273540 RepID=A0A9Q0GT25_9MAGN|nr:hypothetical protein NE237_029916 [Protea cynaroides]
MAKVVDGLKRINEIKCSSISSNDEKEMAKKDRLIRANEIESSSSSEDDDFPIRSIFCLKNKASLKEFDQVEDCYILEFDPFESVNQFEKLSLDDDDDDDDAEEVSVIGHRFQAFKLQTSKHLTHSVKKEDGLIMANKAESSSSSEDEDSSISSILCLKKNVAIEEFDKVEDCFILDFDPFESVNLSDKLSCKDDDAEELSIIGQRGKVACLDYPHSRHLCAKFPFNKTPHEVYCKQCYCYVCDLLAPCKSWKKQGGRHCDAEHDEYWNDLRRQNQSALALTSQATVAFLYTS